MVLSGYRFPNRAGGAVLPKGDAETMVWLHWANFPDSNVKTLYSRIRDIVGMTVLHIVRALETVFPPDALRRVLLPLAAILALLDICFRRSKTIPFDKYPASWPPVRRSVHLFFKLRTRFHLTRLITHWPDRLGETRWRERFEIKGGVLDDAMGSKRPVILVSAHFGPFHLPGYLLRAAGFPVATFVRNTAAAKSMVRTYKTRLGHFPEMRHWFSAEDPLREICRFLKQGNILRMAFDLPIGRLVEVRMDETIIRFATGSIRLAALANARLIPFAISEREPWKFVIHLGEPVPSELLGDSPDIQRAAAHIVTECFNIFKLSPEESGGELLDAISSAAPVGETISA